MLSRNGIHLWSLRTWKMHKLFSWFFSKTKCWKFYGNPSSLLRFIRFNEVCRDSSSEFIFYLNSFCLIFDICSLFCFTDWGNIQEKKQENPNGVKPLDMVKKPLTISFFKTRHIFWYWRFSIFIAMVFDDIWCWNE